MQARYDGLQRLGGWLRLGIAGGVSAGVGAGREMDVVEDQIGEVKKMELAES